MTKYQIFAKSVINSLKKPFYPRNYNFLRLLPLFAIIFNLLSLYEHKEHAHNIKDERGFKCLICPPGMFYEGICQISNHLGRAHKIDNLSVHEHYTRIDPKKMVYCEWCDVTYSSSINLRCHMKLVHGLKKQGKYKCSQCDARFVKSVTRDLHMAKKHGKKQTLENPLPVTSSEKSSSNITEFVCTICNTEQSSFETLKAHLKIMHKNQKNLKILELPSPIVGNNESKSGDFAQSNVPSCSKFSDDESAKEIFKIFKISIKIFGQYN